jgi:hypothetical protein
MNTSPVVVEQNHKHCSVKCFSWSATFVGGLIGLGLGFLLNLFSIAIGLSAFTTTQAGISTFAVGGFIGFAIGTFASMFAAGWISGYLGRPNCATCNSGALYGFVAWCLTLILGVMLAGPVSHFVSAYSSNLTNHTLTVIKYGNERPNAEVAAVSSPDGTTVATTDVEKTANDAGKAALALFALFFLGAIASSFGGHFGMSCRKGCCGTGCGTKC